MERKPTILGLLSMVRDEEQHFISSLTAEERQVTGTFQQWSAKDTLAHITAWHMSLAERLEKTAHGEKPQYSDDTEEQNEGIFNTWQYRTWEEILAESAKVFATIFSRVQTLGEKDLSDTNYIVVHPPRPCWRVIVGNSFIHPVTHLAAFYLRRGDEQIASQLQQTAADLLLQVDDTPSWKGLILYNLACHYALMGKGERAVELLSQALTLAPEITEWSKTDNDLVSLRERPDYQALYVPADKKSVSSF